MKINWKFWKKKQHAMKGAWRYKSDGITKEFVD